jgi:hypothetical protein
MQKKWRIRLEGEEAHVKFLFFWIENQFLRMYRTNGCQTLERTRKTRRLSYPGLRYPLLLLQSNERNHTYEWNKQRMSYWLWAADASACFCLLSRFFHFILWLVIGNYPALDFSTAKAKSFCRINPTITVLQQIRLLFLDEALWLTNQNKGVMGRSWVRGIVCLKQSVRCWKWETESQTNQKPSWKTITATRDNGGPLK